MSTSEEASIRAASSGSTSNLWAKKTHTSPMGDTRGCAQFDYTNLDGVIANLKKMNAMEESLTKFQLLNIDGSRILPE
ncbi:hypothetical protein [Caballeronia novacaledonica]|uniref:Uncharacterized protein n=1 Tax=Caballeronia novacaledonica TaxID=1544861 RepID=A0AA37MUF6_9BURK|nr:hypothetical protein [Caballeronia novacaledonica]GJH29307.1 hypothetical protein CBA19CS42_32345 [Caballeronia novacaledonica]